MKMYELMYIVPSRYADNEVDGVVKTVNGMVEKAGGAIVKSQNLGKLKLAYPINGVRHGTYVLVHFNAEPSVVSGLDRALGLADEVLRHTMLIAKTGAENKKVELNAYVAPLSEEGRDSREETRRPSSSTPVRSATPAAAATAVRPAEPAMSIEELDKKLDEILDSDVTKGV